MAVIEFLKLKGTNCYDVSINNRIITINNWKDESDLLQQFIIESEQLLLANDYNLIRSLPSKYGLKNSNIFFTLCETVFRELFMSCFNSYGISFLEQGKFFSASAFCNFIHPSRGDYLRRKYSTLFNDAEINFDYQVALPYLRKAFNQFSFSKVRLIYKTLWANRFFHLAIDKLDTYFKTYLHFCAKQLFQNGSEVSYLGLCKLAFTPTINCYKFDKVQMEVIMEVVEFWRNEYIKNRMTLGHSLWSISYLDIQKNRFVQLSFKSINYFLKLEIQQYLLFWFEKGESAKALARRHNHLYRIAIEVQVISPECRSFLHLTYVEVLQIFDVLQQKKNKNDQKKYGLKTIQSTFSEARLLFDWLKTKNLNETLKNPFRRIKFHNINSFVKNAKYIPDEVVEQLSTYINECPVYVQRIWLIMMNTGVRASEALNLKEDCLVYNGKEDIYYLKYLAHKTLNQRRRMGLEDYHSVPILSNEIVDVINQQIKETENLRHNGKTEYIFIKFANSHRKSHDESVTRHLGTTISNIINKCIERNEIKDNKGNPWHYSNHQCRKSLAVKLLSEGSSISEVGEILGHMEEKTTRQYYQDVDAMKIAKLDHQLFEQLFETIDKDTRKTYTPLEFEQLKLEVMTGSRETPEGHGSCLKHVSFGPCKKRSCVGCSLLLTGPQKLPMWRKLHAEQQTYIDNMIQMMNKQGISDYENYRDYQAESHLLTLYTDTIDKIEKFMKRRTTTHDDK